MLPPPGSENVLVRHYFFAHRFTGFHDTQSVRPGTFQLPLFRFCQPVELLTAGQAPAGKGEISLSRSEKNVLHIYGSIGLGIVKSEPGMLNIVLLFLFLLRRIVRLVGDNVIRPAAMIPHNPETGFSPFVSVGADNQHLQMLPLLLIRFFIPRTQEILIHAFESILIPVPGERLEPHSFLFVFLGLRNNRLVVTLHGNGYELYTPRLPDRVVIHQYFRIPLKLNDIRWRYLSGRLLPELPHTERPHGLPTIEKTDPYPVLTILPTSDRKTLLLKSAGKPELPGSRQSLRLFMPGYIHFYRAAGNPMLPDPNEKQRFSLIGIKRLPRGALDELVLRVYGDYVPVIRRIEVRRVESKAVTADLHTAPVQYGVKPVFPHLPRAVPGSVGRIKPPIIDQGIENADSCFPVVQLNITSFYYLRVSLGLTDGHLRTEIPSLR